MSFAARINHFLPYWIRRSPYDIFPNHVLERFPPESIGAGNCLICRLLLTEADRQGCGMCDVCFDRVVKGTINYCCIISDEVLEDEKIQGQKEAPDVMEHNIETGYATDYFLLIVNVIQGLCVMIPTIQKTSDAQRSRRDVSGDGFWTKIHQAKWPSYKA